MQKFENTLWSGKCLSGEMSSRGSVLRGSVRSGNCPFGEMSVGEVSVGEVSVGDLSSGKCQSRKCPVGKLSYNLKQRIILKQYFLVLKTLFYTFLMLKNTCQIICRLVSCVPCVPCGPSPFLLFTQDYLFAHSYSHSSLILLIFEIFPVTCILFSVCLCNTHSVNSLIYRG